MVMLSIAPINEIKLMALLVLLAAPLLTGLALGRSRGVPGRMAGLALGLTVGVVAVVVIVAMLGETNRTEMILTGPAGAGTLAPGDPGVEVRYTFPVDGSLHGKVTPVWTLLYPARVLAAVLCAWFVTTRLWALGRMASRFVARPQRAGNSPS